MCSGAVVVEVRLVAAGSCHLRSVMSQVMRCENPKHAELGNLKSSSSSSGNLVWPTSNWTPDSSLKVTIYLYGEMSTRLDRLFHSLSTFRWYLRPPAPRSAWISWEITPGSRDHTRPSPIQSSPNRRKRDPDSFGRLCLRYAQLPW